jgi:[ribosomal protein S18]-alanine N-acetyltransferase
VSVALRRMRWWDIEQVTALEQEVFDGDDPWSAEMFWADLALGDAAHYVVAVDATDAADGGIAGYAGLVESAGSAEVRTIAVAPAARGRRVGAALLADLLAEADQRGVTEVLLEVRADNAVAQSLYERAGFQQVGVRRGYYRSAGVDGLVMRRKRRRRSVREAAGG